MVQEVGAKAIMGNSANLTMTKEYLVVKGKHFQVRNGYLNCSNQTQAVAVKDILSMEYLTMRSKRLFILFMVLMTFVVFGGVGIRKTLSVTRQIDKEVQKIENVYNQMSDEDIDIDITGSVKSAFSQLGIKGIIIVYALLVVGSVGCFVLYWLVSAVLTNLCTYVGVLPQGAVTSPYIANLICYHLDARLNGFCR